MRKAMLCLLVLLLGAGLNAFGQGAEKKNSAQPPLPKVIHTVTLTGQTNNIPQTTIFTPKSSGLVRISLYMTVTIPSSQFGCAGVAMTWTDDGGPQETFPVNTLSQNTACFQFLETDVGPFGAASTTLAIRADAGTPVTYEVSNVPSGTTYELYITVEQLM